MSSHGLLVQGILLELPLAGFFLKKLLARGCDLNDLPTLDAELYRSLLLLRDYAGDVEDLALTFTVSNDALGDNSEVRGARGTAEPCRAARAALCSCLAAEVAMRCGSSREPHMMRNSSRHGVGSLGCSAHPVDLGRHGRNVRLSRQDRKTQNPICRAGGAGGRRRAARGDRRQPDRVHHARGQLPAQRADPRRQQRVPRGPGGRYRARLDAHVP